MLEVVLEQIDVEDRVDGRDRERGDNSARGEELELCGVLVRLHRASDREQPRGGVRVEEPIVRHPKDLGELSVVGGHRRRPRLLLHRHDERVHVLDSAVRLLPELHVRRGAQLRKARLEVRLQRLGGRRLAVLPLRIVLGLRLDVVAQDVAEPPELGGALVLAAEGEGAQRRVSVEVLKLRVVPQDLQHGAEGFPQELEGRCDQLALDPLLAVGRPADGREHQRLGRLLRLEILEVEQAREARVDLCRGRIDRPLRLLLGELHEVAQHVLHRRDVDLLTDDAVLDEPVLGRLPLLHVDADVQELGHHFLDRRLPRAVPLRGEDVVQRHQRGILLADGDQLLGPFQGVRWV